MFTGLIQATGTLAAVERDGDGLALEVDGGALVAELGAGDSVAVNGVCLTATEVGGGRFAADVMAETARRSTLALARGGDPVNLELPLRATDRLGGHVVQGHVDGVGSVESLADEALARVVRIAAPEGVLRYVVEKGSIAVDGVSLTVAEVDGDAFEASLIPETLQRTALGTLEAGRRVNLEVDVLAKYVEKLVLATAGAAR